MDPNGIQYGIQPRVHFSPKRMWQACQLIWRTNVDEAITQPNFQQPKTRRSGAMRQDIALLIGSRLTPRDMKNEKVQILTTLREKLIEEQQQQNACLSSIDQLSTLIKSVRYDYDGKWSLAAGNFDSLESLVDETRRQIYLERQFTALPKAEVNDRAVELYDKKLRNHRLDIIHRVELN
ncbi:hypothetical protein TELCIR_13243 [Teladorsagia circumcincta]|uniref:Uncharacterized protein n=1 Tax=Teladorsagia circumcincta TaxID=45464 RepID=A0A2G9U4D8_TELCI|nr:hypothetical protein TELCIR_13243 [Teladorsagia circumcincta]